jgi:hypothetical protein
MKLTKEQFQRLYNNYEDDMGCCEVDGWPNTYMIYAKGGNLLVLNKITRKFRSKKRPNIVRLRAELKKELKARIKKQHPCFVRSIEEFFTLNQYHERQLIFKEIISRIQSQEVRSEIIESLENGGGIDYPETNIFFQRLKDLDYLEQKKNEIISAIHGEKNETK